MNELYESSTLHPGWYVSTACAIGSLVAHSVEAMVMRTLYVIRGLPGAGKSTLAHRIAQRHLEGIGYAISLSTDDFFMQGSKYVFEPSRIKMAHEWNQERALNAMRCQQPVVIVANTFTQHWEMEPYKRMAQEHGYMVQEITVKTDLSDVELAQRNVHGVPAETIRKMRERWEP